MDEAYIFRHDNRGPLSAFTQHGDVGHDQYRPPIDQEAAHIKRSELPRETGDDGLGDISPNMFLDMPGACSNPLLPHDRIWQAPYHHSAPHHLISPLGLTTVNRGQVCGLPDTYGGETLDDPLPRMKLGSHSCGGAETYSSAIDEKHFSLHPKST